MAYKTVLYDVADRICTIALNHSDKLNAFTHQCTSTAGTPRKKQAQILTYAP